MKKSNILQMLETHVDKIVLGALSLVSLVILWVYVIGNPYGVQVEGQKRGPGEIDSYVAKRADALRQELDKFADPIIYDKTYLADFEKLLQCPVSEIASLPIPYPGKGEAGIDTDRRYPIPEIVPLTGVAALHLRGAGLVPLEQATPDNSLAGMNVELQDVDLVTVSANFNVQSLYNAFQQSFYGPRLKAAWRDSNFAKPVFARVDLQRRELFEDGTWGDWTAVSRTKIDMYRKLIEDLPLTTDQLQYDVSVWIQQYADKKVQQDVLQPQAYTFNISRAEWMPPTYLQQALDLIKKQEDAALRQQREERAKLLESASKETGMTGRRSESTRTQPRPEPRRQPAGRRGRENPVDMMMPGNEMLATPRQPVRKERTLNDIKAEVQKTLLTDQAGPESMKDSLLVWAHDDTARPGSTYQYRLRIGVFNPIAGKGWCREDQVQYNNQIVLWSGFTDPTGEIYVPKRVHVFPIEMIAAKNGSSAEGVKVEVAKFNLGRWRTQTFDVYPGQVIGQKAEPKVDQKPVQPGAEMGLEMGLMPGMIDPMAEPAIVDFTTSYVMVDVNHLLTWGTAAQRRSTYDIMLYHDSILRMRQAAIGRANWSADLRKEYQLVQDEMDRAVQQRMIEGGGEMPFFEGGPFMQGGV
ncbi:MAG: hypothetical protein LLF76_14045 [Planctomycetaceae bacterium]|nr:hypothetical protein [Planctomycetaceae bacterium]